MKPVNEYSGKGGQQFTSWKQGGEDKVDCGKECRGRLTI